VVGSVRRLRTSDIARAVGCHPNTVRLYEEWGFLPPVPRSRSGYRLYTEEHLDQMGLARTALRGPWPGRKIKAAALSIVRLAAAEDLGGALEEAYRYQMLVQTERVEAEGAVALLERWARGVPTDATEDVLHIGQAARLLGVTTDMLRNWERNGLIKVPRDPRNGYRLYGAEEIGRLRVVRVLARAKYSQMAILRMLLRLDQGEVEGLREALDTPRSDEDVLHATDHWLSTLSELEERAQNLITQLERMIAKRSGDELL
jgi:DNA-binding transcriptional MerR regulator